MTYTFACGCVECPDCEGDGINDEDHVDAGEECKSCNGRGTARLCKDCATAAGWFNDKGY
jgi:DnaJ-class molecular chaperone